MIPSFMIAGAVTGGLTMASGCGVLAADAARGRVVGAARRNLGFQGAPHVGSQARICPFGPDILWICLTNHTISN